MSLNLENAERRSDESEENPSTPITTQEMADEVLEVLSGEGEPISERAPTVPFAVVFMTYPAVLILSAIVIAILIWIFGFRS